MTYFFLIAAIERASAVFVGIQRNPHQKTWQSRVTRLASLLDVEDESKIEVNKLRRTYAREKTIVDRLEKEEKIIPIQNVPDSDPSTEEYIGYLTTVRQVYQFQLTKYNAETTKLVTTAKLSLNQRII